MFLSNILSMGVNFGELTNIFMFSIHLYGLFDYLCVVQV